MKKIKRIFQRRKNDCGVACVAMVARVSYEQAFDALDFPEGTKKFYTSRNQIIEALGKFGILMQRKWFRSWEEIPGCAIVPVNHRCNRKNFHWVVYDGKAVLEPYAKRPESARCLASGWYLLVVAVSNDCAFQ